MVKPLDGPSKLFRVFADPVRLRLISLLSEGRELCVHHMHETLGLPQPTVSRHLAYLRKHGLVATRKEGLRVHYRLAKPTSPLHRSLLVCVAACLGDEAAIAHDRERVERVLARGGPA
jgi:ArsR family transcriptional regulator